jgi:hypothetical protein
MPHRSSSRGLAQGIKIICIAISIGSSLIVVETKKVTKDYLFGAGHYGFVARIVDGIFVFGCTSFIIDSVVAWWYTKFQDHEDDASCPRGIHELGDSGERCTHEARALRPETHTAALQVDEGKLEPNAEKQAPYSDAGHPGATVKNQLHLRHFTSHGSVKGSEADKPGASEILTGKDGRKETSKRLSDLEDEQQVIRNPACAEQTTASIADQAKHPFETGTSANTQTPNPIDTQSQDEAKWVEAVRNSLPRGQHEVDTSLMRTVESISRRAIAEMRPGTAEFQNQEYLRFKNFIILSGDEIDQANNLDALGAAHKRFCNGAREWTHPLMVGMLNPLNNKTLERRGYLSQTERDRQTPGKTSGVALSKDGKHDRTPVAEQRAHADTSNPTSKTSESQEVIPALTATLGQNGTIMGEIMEVLAGLYMSADDPPAVHRAISTALGAPWDETWHILAEPPIPLVSDRTQPGYPSSQYELWPRMYYATTKDVHPYLDMLMAMVRVVFGALDTRIPGHSRYNLEINEIFREIQQLTKMTKAGIELSGRSGIKATDVDVLSERIVRLGKLMGGSIANVLENIVLSTQDELGNAKCKVREKESTLSDRGLDETRIFEQSNDRRLDDDIQTEAKEKAESILPAEESKTTVWVRHLFGVALPSERHISSVKSGLGFPMGNRKYKGQK